MTKYLNLRTNIAIGLIFAFLVNSLGPLPSAQAKDFILPAPGVMVALSSAFNPPILKGLKVHPDNPFRFDFILDRGDSQSSNNTLKDQSTKLIKYFLASLTIPENDLWVNLSPYEKDRIIPNSFGLTEMGRDLLAEDYMLKQITASLIYPEGGIGRRFWKRVYEEAAKRYGTTNIPVNTFNKVWIVPEKAVVYENAKAGTAYIVESKLKVMLEQDYLALSHSVIARSPQGDEGPHAGHSQELAISSLGSQIVREIVIPQLTREINEDKNFAQLRQVYNSFILAAWYKKKIRDSILEQVYADKNKVAGVSIDDPQEKERIYQRYLQAFKKGSYNYIKEEQDPVTQQTTPRKYFSGGIDWAMAGRINFIDQWPKGINEKDNLVMISSQIDAAMVSFKIRENNDIAGLPPDEARQFIKPGFQRSFYRTFGDKLTVGTGKDMVFLSSLSSDPGYRQKVVDLIERVAGGDKGKEILSVGEGQGHLVEALRRKGFKNVFALDLMESFARQARNRTEGKIPLVVANAQALPFPDRKFDVLIFNECIGTMHLDDVMKESYRVLKADGKVVIISYSIFPSKYQSSMSRLANYLFYSPKEIYNSIKKFGFTKMVKDTKFFRVPFIVYTEHGQIYDNAATDYFVVVAGKNGDLPPLAQRTVLRGFLAAVGRAVGSSMLFSNPKTEKDRAMTTEVLRLKLKYVPKDFKFYAIYKGEPVEFDYHNADFIFNELISAVEERGDDPVYRKVLNKLKIVKHGYGDLPGIHFVLRELQKNAARAIEDSGKKEGQLDVIAYLEKGKFIISLSDDGKGLLAVDPNKSLADIKKWIFGDGSSTKDEDLDDLLMNAGEGLYLSQGFVEDRIGDGARIIPLDNKADRGFNKDGATFNIVIPVEDPHQQMIVQRLKQLGGDAQQLGQLIIADPEHWGFILTDPFLNNDVFWNKDGLEQRLADFKKKREANAEYFSQLKTHTAAIYDFSRWILDQPKYKDKEIIVLGKSADPIYDALFALTHTDDHYEQRLKDISLIDFSATLLNKAIDYIDEYKDYFHKQLRDKGVNRNFDNVVFINEVSHFSNKTSFFLRYFIGNQFKLVSGFTWDDYDKRLGRSYDGKTDTWGWADWLDIRYKSGRRYNIEIKDKNVDHHYVEDDPVQRWMNQEAVYLGALSKSNDTAMLIPRETLKRGLTYEEAGEIFEHRGSIKRFPNGFFSNETTAKNYILAVLDSLPGFKKARDGHNVLEMKKIYEKEVKGYQAKDKNKYKNGQMGFFYEYGRLGSLMDSNPRFLNSSKSKSAYALLKFVLFELVDPKNPDAFRASDLADGYLQDEIYAKEEILIALFTIDGFREAWSKGNVPEMAGLYRSKVIGGKGGQLEFFKGFRGVNSLLAHGTEFLTTRGSTYALLRFTIPDLVDQSNPDALRWEELSNQGKALYAAVKRLVSNLKNLSDAQPKKAKKVSDILYSLIHKEHENENSPDRFMEARKKFIEVLELAECGKTQDGKDIPLSYIPDEIGTILNGWIESFSWGGWRMRRKSTNISISIVEINWPELFKKYPGGELRIRIKLDNNVRNGAVSADFPLPNGQRLGNRMSMLVGATKLVLLEITAKTRGGTIVGPLRFIGTSLEKDGESGETKGVERVSELDWRGSIAQRRFVIIQDNSMVSRDRAMAIGSAQEDKSWQDIFQKLMDGLLKGFSKDEHPVLFITGIPGAGKTTMAGRFKILLEQHGHPAVIIPVDAFLYPKKIILRNFVFKQLYSLPKFVFRWQPYKNIYIDEVRKDEFSKEFELALHDQKAQLEVPGQGTVNIQPGTVFIIEGVMAKDKLPLLNSAPGAVINISPALQQDRIEQRYIRRGYHPFFIYFLKKFQGRKSLMDEHVRDLGNYDYVINVSDSNVPTMKSTDRAMIGDSPPLITQALAKLTELLQYKDNGASLPLIALLSNNYTHLSFKEMHIIAEALDQISVQELSGTPSQFILAEFILNGLMTYARYRNFFYGRNKPLLADQISWDQIRSEEVIERSGKYLRLSYQFGDKNEGHRFLRVDYEDGYDVVMSTLSSHEINLTHKLSSISLIAQIIDSEQESKDRVALGWSIAKHFGLIYAPRDQTHLPFSGVIARTLLEYYKGQTGYKMEVPLDVVEFLISGPFSKEAKDILGKIISSLDPTVSVVYLHAFSERIYWPGISDRAMAVTLLADAEFSEALKGREVLFTKVNTQGKIIATFYRRNDGGRLVPWFEIRPAGKRTMSRLVSIQDVRNEEVVLLPIRQSAQKVRKRSKNTNEMQTGQALKLNFRENIESFINGEMAEYPKKDRVINKLLLFKITTIGRYLSLSMKGTAKYHYTEKQDFEVLESVLNNKYGYYLWKDGRWHPAKDKAMVTEEGGIDLTSDRSLSIQNNGQGIKFHIDPAQLQQLQNAPGFVPVIINIQPMTDLRLFLGLTSNSGKITPESV